MPRFTMKFISICSGIDAASVAFNPLGWKAVAFSEIEPFPCAVLAHHYPDVPNLGDMTRYAEWLDEIFLEADAIVGGPPCQAFSVAGMRNGLNDERGNLSLTYFQLINHADSIRKNHGRPPVIALYENVPGLLSDKTGAFGCLLAGLAGEDEAIDVKKWPRAGVVDGGRRRVAWVTLDAQFFGVAQRRRRVFVLAVPGELVERLGDRAHPAEILSIGNCLRRDTPPRREAGQEAAHATAPCLTSSGRGVGRVGDTRGQDPVVAVPHVDTMPTLRAGAPNGGAGHGARSGDCKDEYIVPVVAFHPTQDPISSTDGSTHAMGCGSSGGQASVAVAYALQDVRDVQKAQNGRGWNDEGVSYTVDTHATQGVAYSTKLHNTTNNQAGKFYEEYTTALDRSSPPPAVIAPVAIGAFKGGQGSAAGGIGWDAHVSPTLSSADRGSNRAPVVLTGESEVVGALACNTGPNGHDAGNFACNQAVDAGHVLPVVAMRESGQGYWMQDDIAGTLRAEGEDRPSRPSHVIGQAFQCSQSGARVGDTAATLRGSTGGGIHDHGALVAMQVRRLTPEECEKLQGFPPGYTMIPWRKKPAEMCPDGVRYKALGNSWAVPVVTWIGRRIDSALSADQTEPSLDAAIQKPATQESGARHRDPMGS